MNHGTVKLQEDDREDDREVARSLGRSGSSEGHTRAQGGANNDPNQGQCRAESAGAVDMVGEMWASFFSFEGGRCGRVWGATPVDFLSLKYNF